MKRFWRELLHSLLPDVGCALYIVGFVGLIVFTLKAVTWLFSL